MAGDQEQGFGQLGFDLGDNSERKSYAPTAEEVRTELLDILAAARTAEDASPWDRRTLAYHRTVFPQMARWLPDDERDQLCFEFAEHVERIERLLAA
jgi:hypothetical protein